MEFRLQITVYPHNMDDLEVLLSTVPHIAALSNKTTNGGKLLTVDGEAKDLVYIASRLEGLQDGQGV